MNVLYNILVSHCVHCMCMVVVHTLKSHVCLFEYCDNEPLYVAAMYDNRYWYGVAMYGEREYNTDY